MTTKPDYDALVIGAGFSGLAVLHHLREKGLKTIVVDGGWSATKYLSEYALSSQWSISPD